MQIVLQIPIYLLLHIQLLKFNLGNYYYHQYILQPVHVRAGYVGIVSGPDNILLTAFFFF